MEQIGPARPDERPAIEALLTAAGLPHDDIGPHLAYFTVAREGERVVGVIGLEVHGQDGLVRSLAVAPDRRGLGVARRLYASSLARAQRAGITRLYVVAPAAQGWFALLGFRTAAPESVPDAIRTTHQFQLLSDHSAVLVRSMPRSS